MVAPSSANVLGQHMIVQPTPLTEWARAPRSASWPRIHKAKSSSTLGTLSMAPPLHTPLDGVDRRILAELQHDGRLSFNELSRRVNLSAPAVAERGAAPDRPRGHHRLPRTRQIGRASCREGG